MTIPQWAMVVACAVRGILLAATTVMFAVSTASARTPTPTDGPPPTVTQTSSPTPTGTPPIPVVRLTVSPNPARSGQVVTLDASGNGRSAMYQWSQVGDVPLLQFDFVHQAVVHFVAPDVAQVGAVSVQVAVSGYNSGPAVVEITLLPRDAVVAQVGSGDGVPGTVVSIDVTLRPNGLLVTQVEHEIDYGPYAVVVDRGDGVPDCQPGAALGPTAASFAFLPPGCTGSTCTGVHASLTTHDPIPQAGVAYSCMVFLSEAVSPPDEGCSHLLQCQAGTAASMSGAPLRILCPYGADGHAVANYFFGPPQFVFAADPPAPFVGDAVRVTFTVLGDGGLPQYTLLGADPIFSGIFVATPGGALGTVTFDLQANCPGTAPLSLNVNYETRAGCPGNTFYQFTNQTSPMFPLVVRDSITPPPPTPSATPTPTCAATGTPYCATQCLPCPTIREGCLAVDCGDCIQSPTCGDAPSDERCGCVTPTPPIETAIEGGLVYDAAIGRDAPIANAEIDYEIERAGVYPNPSGSVHSGVDGRYRLALPLQPEDVVDLTVGAPGFATLGSTLGASQLFAGQPQDFGLALLGGRVAIEPGDMTIDCYGSFPVTVTNVGAPGETLVITAFSFGFDYGEGVYGMDFTWDIGDIEFPLSLAGGAHVSFPMSFGGGQFPSRLFFNVISGARNGTVGVAYFGRDDDCTAGTPTPIPPCAGDCNGDGRVTVDELLRGVRTALGVSVMTCPALDTNGDGTVSIGELIAAVDRALNGCGR